MNKKLKRDIKRVLGARGAKKLINEIMQCPTYCTVIPFLDCVCVWADLPRPFGYMGALADKIDKNNGVNRHDF